MHSQVGTSPPRNVDLRRKIILFPAVHRCDRPSSNRIYVVANHCPSLCFLEYSRLYWCQDPYPALDSRGPHLFMFVSHGIHTRHPSSHPFRRISFPHSSLSIIFSVHRTEMIGILLDLRRSWAFWIEYSLVHRTSIPHQISAGVFSQNWINWMVNELVLWLTLQR